MDNKVCYNILEQLKKQMIGVISALILIFAAILGFEIIGQI